jgi:lysophospholipase L1-like esterase
VTRIYTFSIGRGFSENPIWFTSPFFTTEDWPAPYKTGKVYEFKRGERIQGDKEKNEIRIICFGGSTTLNTGNQEGVSYSQLLESQLSIKFPDIKIRVLNVGGNAFSSAHTLVNFALRVLDPDIQPDIITVYHNINDLSVNYFGNETLPDYANKYLNNFYLNYHHKTGFISHFLRMSRFLRFLWYKLNILTYKNDRDPNKNYHRGLIYFERNLRSIIAIAKANGIDVVFATQAARDNLRSQKGFTAYNDVIRKVARDQQIVFVDIANNVVGDEKYFLDDVHYTGEGVKKVADLFYIPVLEIVGKRIDNIRLSKNDSMNFE